jgi:hypothetical protein
MLKIELLLNKINNFIIMSTDLNINENFKKLTVSKKKSKKKTSVNNDTVNLNYINNRIDKEFCEETVNKLKDSYLINEYKECKSVKNEIKKLESILEKYKIETKKKESILNDYILELIPAGTKGVIRGNKFNSIVKDTINNLKLDNERFEICFEKKCESCITSEIPDWYILEKITGKVIIGMNQLDLVGGGQQINRGYKYLIDNKHNTEKSKLLCVICNYIQFKSNNKKTKLFEVGFANNTLCYIKNIGIIINKYFN